MRVNARKFLAESDWSMARIAKKSGFHDGRHLSEVFHAQTGEALTAFRRRFRIGAA